MGELQMKMLMRALLMLVTIGVLADAKQPTPRFPFGIDVYLGRDVFKLKATYGDNLTSIVQEFVNGPAQPAVDAKGIDLITNMLHNAAGGSCDACVTMVEHLTEYFRTISLQKRPQGQDALAKERVAIDLNDENGMVNAICGSKEYDYAPHMKKACREWLKPPYRKTVLYSYEGAPLEPRFIVDHKQDVCANRLQVCPIRRLKKVPNKCRACAEVFQTLDYYLRRDRQSVVAKGFRSSSHVALRLVDLCDNLYLHFEQGRVLDRVQELCEDMVGDHEYVIARDFASWRSVKTTCVNVVGACKPETFDQIATKLQLFNLNTTMFSGSKFDVESNDDHIETPRPQGTGRHDYHVEL